ncbi:NAD(P)-binding domain-containing protein [Streptomyces sp. JV185]|uniref:NAD(P)-binding domain-containing protein n=1 Tax=Streptomyces sp. JV185 TaxID=858638 RepID=UPI002E7A7602|nr:NAD(P)-binding domain-containing protein [Streptomyces sp. JV185]MEE1772486.1 NAD(P)-binding domain-containing protein [Streptomyces sp. JV185]
MRRRRPPRIRLSPRGARTAAELSQRYPNVRVCADNQDVANRSEVAVLTVRPQDRAEVLVRVRVGDDGVVISLMAGVGIGELRETLGTGTPVVRAIPQPTVRERRSVTVTCPSHPVADDLFDGLGVVCPSRTSRSHERAPASTGVQVPSPVDDMIRSVLR